jgi:hypothetical protein
MNYPFVAMSFAQLAAWTGVCYNAAGVQFNENKLGET